MLAGMGPSDMPDPLARYGFAIAVAAFFVGVFGSAVVGGIYAAITGADIDSYGVSIASLFGLWMGTLGVPIVASRRWGSGNWRRDYAVDIEWRPDVPLGIGIGVVGQVVLVPVVVGLFKLLEPHLKLNEASVDLARRSHGAGFLALGVLVSVVAPVVEEIF